MSLPNSVMRDLVTLFGRERVLTEGRDLSRYSRDQSIYHIEPRAVVFPNSEEELPALVSLARKAAIPLTARGGGSSTAGGCLGRGIVIAFPRDNNFQAIGDFSESADKNGRALVTAQAGVLHSDLQKYLHERGYFLPADPSSAKICRIGGNVATKASGPHALRHGSIDKYLKSVKFVAASGAIVDTAIPSSIPADLMEAILNLQKEILADEKVCKRLQQRMDRKIASGYNLFAFLRQIPANELLAQLLVGSVGTLGIILSATLYAEKALHGEATLLLAFKSLRHAGEAVLALRDLDVAAIEIMNAQSVKVVCERRKTAPDVLAMDGHVLLVEFSGDQAMDNLEKAEKLVASSSWDMSAPPKRATNADEQKSLWATRKALLPTFMHYGPNLKAISVVNDVGLPPEHLAEFITDVENIFEDMGLVGAIYGHAGNGNLHLRPLFDLTSPQLHEQIRQLTQRVYGALFKYDGTITAEHGMGRLRAPFLAAEWGLEVFGYMMKIKQIFDEADLLNPEVMFSERDILSDLAPSLR